MKTSYIALDSALWACVAACIFGMMLGACLVVAGAGLSGAFQCPPPSVQEKSP